jgi:NifU-like protein involved in Fe-S cluster formation
MAALYTTEILRLASSLVANEHLPTPNGTAECRSPICGSVIHAQVNISDGIIAQLAIRASACAMGQASAAIVRGNAPNNSTEMIANLRSDLEAFLQGESPMPEIWPDLMTLAPAKDYPARHAAILLPYDAIIAAAEDAQKASAA